MKQDKLQPIRSFVRRQGRMTRSQKRALENLWPRFGLSIDNSDHPVNFDSVFRRSNATRVLEIGFGNGESLCAQARANPEKDFIGIEVYLPGVGRLLDNINSYKISNIQVFQEDAVEVLSHCISDASIDIVQIFFPDPWHKKAHHKRRLVQPKFVQLLLAKLRSGGRLHLATDWEPYAEQMMRVLSEMRGIKNLAGEGIFWPDPYVLRPITKFELRGLRRQHLIRDLFFEKLSTYSPTLS